MDQTCSIAWYLIDGGGTTSGGGYELTVTTWLLDAGKLVDGSMDGFFNSICWQIGRRRA